MILRADLRRIKRNMTRMKTAITTMMIMTITTMMIMTITTMMIMTIMMTITMMMIMTIMMMITTMTTIMMMGIPHQTIRMMQWMMEVLISKPRMWEIQLTATAKK